MQEVIFNIFVLLTLVPCLWVAFSPNIVHAAFSLLFTLFGAAGLLVMLGADFIGVMQGVVYIGGILVLIVFGVMMTQGPELLPLSVKLPGRVVAGLFTLLLLAALCLAALSTAWPVAAKLPKAEPTAEAIGDLLLGKYLIPFELASLLLLGALVGAVLIVRQSVKGD